MIGRDLNKYKACEQYLGIGRRKDGLCEYCHWPKGAHSKSESGLIIIFALVWMGAIGLLLKVVS